MPSEQALRSVKHEHAWKGVAHLDLCHGYSWVYTCECGASRETYAERDIESDPYSMVWMDPEGREPCVRCEQLIGGATPEHRDTITEAGTEA